MAARDVRRVIRILRSQKEESAPWRAVGAGALAGALWTAVPRRVLATFFPRRWCAGGAGGLEQYRAFLARCYQALALNRRPAAWRATAQHLWSVGWDGEQMGLHHAPEAGRRAPPLPCAAYLALFRRFAGGAVTLPRLLNLLAEHVMPRVLPQYRLTPGIKLQLLLTPAGWSDGYRFPCRRPHHALPVRVVDMRRWGDIVRRAVAQNLAAADPLLTNAQKRQLLWRARHDVRGFAGSDGDWNVHTKRGWTAHRTWDLVTHSDAEERRVHQRRAALALRLMGCDTAAARRRRPGGVASICDVIPQAVLEHIVRVYV